MKFSLNLVRLSTANEAILVGTAVTSTFPAQQLSMPRRRFVAAFRRGPTIGPNRYPGATPKRSSVYVEALNGPCGAGLSLTSA